MATEETVTIRNATIIWRNFAGEAKQFNAEGKRNFNVEMDEELARNLIRDGWNCKPKKKQSEESIEEFGRLYTLEVSLAFDQKRPPRIWMITSHGKNLLGPGAVALLDWAEFVKVDLIIRPHHWELASGARGTKAWLRTMNAYILEDELEMEIADIPELGTHGDQPQTMELTSSPHYDYDMDFNGNEVAS